MQSKYSLYFAWLLACLATLGSLFISNILDMPPCDLCWYQRTFIYPLAIILGIASYKEFAGIVSYALPLALLALAFSAYQVLIQTAPSLEVINLCGAGKECTQKIFLPHTPFTIPMLSMGNSLIIVILLTRVNCNNRIK